MSETKRLMLSHWEVFMHYIFHKQTKVDKMLLFQYVYT